MHKIMVGSFVKHANYTHEMKVVKTTQDWITCEWQNDNDKSKVSMDFKPEILTVTKLRSGMNINPNVVREINEALINRR